MLARSWHDRLIMQQGLDLVDGLFRELQFGPEVGPQFPKHELAHEQLVLEQHVSEQISAESSRGERGKQHIRVEEDLHDTSRKTSSSVR